MTTSFSDFLTNHKNEKGSKIHTHTRMPDKELKIYGGSWTIPDNNKFLQTYYKNIITKKQTEHLTEKQLENGVIAVDFDFRYSNDITTKQYNQKHIDDWVCELIEPLKEFYVFNKDTNFDVFVMEKPNVNVLEDGSLTKDGVHFIIRLNMLDSHKVEYRNKLLNTLTFKLPLINDTESVVDNGVLLGQTNWTLYGSKKPAHEAYELTYHYQIGFDTSDGEFMVDKQNIPEMNYDLFKLLSVRNTDNIQTFPTKNVRVSSTKKQTKKNKCDPETDSETSSVENDEPVIETDIYYKYLNCIGSSMCGRGDHFKTIKVLQALRNENCDSKYVSYWIKKYASPDSKKYTYAIDYYKDRDYIKYTPLNVEKRLSIKSLKNWAKQNNVLYGKYFKDDYAFQIKKMFHIDNILTNSQEEGEFMKVIYVLLDKTIILDDEVIYLYYKDEWRTMKEKDCKILKELIREMFEIYIKTTLDIVNEYIKQNLNNEENVKKGKSIHSNICGLTNTIKKIHYIKNICELLKNKLATIKNKIVFDLGADNFYNIHFKNGVYDLKTGFRTRVETDYVTQTLDYDYIEEKEIDENIKNDVYDYFQKIQPDEDQRKFTLSYLAYCLTGNTKKQVFKMNIGHTAQNGKSTEMSIHDKCFELYTYKADKRVLQNEFDKRHKFLSELVKKPIRLLYFEELPKGKKLDVEFIKDFVDGKKLSLEKLFGTTDEFKIQAKIMSVSNHDFNVDTDEGILRRGRVQYYTSKFVDEDSGEIDEENHIYKKVEGFEDKFDNEFYKNAYFHLLLKYIDALYIPSKNKEDFKKTAEENDIILNNILEHFEITNDPTDIVGRYYFDDKVGCGKEQFKFYKEKLQGKGCKYDSQMKYTCKELGKQKDGVFVGLKMRPEEKIVVSEEFLETS
jgi:hypothetical protein